MLDRKSSLGTKKDQLKEEMETLIRQLSPIQKIEDEPHMLNNIQSPNLNNDKNKNQLLLQDDDGATIMRSSEDLDS